ITPERALQRIGDLAEGGASTCGFDRQSEEVRSNSAPGRGGGPLAGGEWWWGPACELLRRWAPSTKPLRVLVPLPVPGRNVCSLSQRIQRRAHVPLIPARPHLLDPRD